MKRDEEVANDQFRNELSIVCDTMLDKASGIGGPLRELVVARVGHDGPIVYAATVLCAGYSLDDSSVEPRTNLAAALELLHVALGIHQLLVDASANQESSPADEEDKSFIGSTILAGDYCFSHAADLAASTKNPTIVELFSKALQDVSAKRLRAYLSSPTSEQHASSQQPDPTLLRSGVMAALELSDLPADTYLVMDDAANTLGKTLANGGLDLSAVFEVNTKLERLPFMHQLRWKSLLAWLQDQPRS